LETVSPVRQFVRTALVILLALMALPAALFVAAWLWFWYKTAEVDSFYREHPPAWRNARGRKAEHKQLGAGA
jgi:hypothetical protein